METDAAKKEVKRYNCLECDHYKENDWICPFTACIYPTMTIHIPKPTVVPNSLNSRVISLD